MPCQEVVDGIGFFRKAQCQAANARSRQQGNNTGSVIMGGGLLPQRPDHDGSGQYRKQGNAQEADNIVIWQRCRRDIAEPLRIEHIDE